jgi:hypothetical protein
VPKIAWGSFLAGVALALLAQIVLNRRKVRA